MRLGPKRNDRLARALEDSVLAIQDSVLAIQGLHTATEELFRAIDESTDDRDHSDERVERLNRRVKALESKVAEISGHLDDLREEGVQRAIAAGAVTSDIDRHHANNAAAYRTLLKALKLSLAKPLCAQSNASTSAYPEERYARAVADLVVLLLRPSAEALTAETALEWLARRGYDTDNVKRSDVEKRIETAAQVRTAMAHPHLHAMLDFDIDVGMLTSGTYDVWNHGPSENGRPCFLVAPAYVTQGNRLKVVEKPYVFVAPPKP